MLTIMSIDVITTESLVDNIIEQRVLGRSLSCSELAFLGYGELDVVTSSFSVHTLVYTDRSNPFSKG